MKFDLPKVNIESFQWTTAAPVRASIAFGVFLFIFLLSCFQTLNRFELVTYDYRCLLRGDRPTQSDIVVIEISDDSIAKIGRWPWDRDWHASLVTILKNWGAKAVVFDVIFSEKSQEKSDQIFSEAIRNNGHVFLAQVIELEPASGLQYLLESLPIFSKYARGGGHINLIPDEDGVMRRIPLYQEVQGQPIPQLAVSVALDAYEADPQKVVFKKGSVQIPTKNGPLKIPLDGKGNFVINWPGRWTQTYAHFSYVDLISSYALFQKGEKPFINPNLLKDKICFVGTTASGLFDIRPTPLEPLYPAVGVNLSVLNNLLEKKFIRQFNFFENSLILFFLGVLMFFVTASSSYFRNAFYTILTLLGYWLLIAVLFAFQGWWINLIYPTLLILITYFSMTLYNQLSIAIERSKLLKMATRDSLTGLYNIGQFKLLLRAELATLAIRQNDRSMSLLMSDADNFKKTNDTYGHLMGDQVLREIASVIKTTCRALDVAARYGGEEFIVMLPGATEQDALRVADKIRTALSQKVFRHEKGDFSMTISLGITQARPGENDIETLIGRADKALYEAKHTGKNKAVIYTDELAQK